MRQLAASGDPAALGPAASTVPWATCLAVMTLFNSSLNLISNPPRRPPESSISYYLREALVRYLANSATPKQLLLHAQ